MAHPLSIRPYDYVSYGVALIYCTLLIGCCMGIRRNSKKKRFLLQSNQYEKQRRVIRWRYRFYLTLFSAASLRIGTIICAVILHQHLVFSESNTESDFFWSFISSIASMFFFSAFSFIIWFFGHLAFHQEPRTKSLITPFLCTLNVAIYASTVSIAISSYTASSWDLLYEYELPLFAVCGWILAICFILLSFKISHSIHHERRRTVDYMEYSRRISATHSVRRYKHSHSPLMDSRGARTSAPNPILYGSQQREQSALSEHSAIRPPPPEPLPPTDLVDGGGVIVPTPSIQRDFNQNNDGNASSSEHIIPRLIKLSLLCALCWTIRGLYTMALWIWPSTDRTPFGIEELCWESMFYCITEYPPSLGALVLMIWKPKRRGNVLEGDGNGMGRNYPRAKQSRY